jgi:hypothetical protein
MSIHESEPLIDPDDSSASLTSPSLRLIPIVHWIRPRTLSRSTRIAH